MTSAEFIAKQLGNDNGKVKTLSSIYKDGRGVIYSYYLHYPLVFNLGELTFVNATGYSNTTAKHINWARQAAGSTRIDVWLSGCNQYSWNNPENYNKVPYMLANRDRFTDDQILRAVFNDLEAELVDINKRIASKTRTDTKLYAALLEERSDCVDRIASTRPYVKGAKNVTVYASVHQSMHDTSENIAKDM